MIFEKEKKYLTVWECAAPRVGILKYKEFAPRNLLKYIRRDPMLMAYFPDDIKGEKSTFGDRIFTWSVLFYKRREWAEQYYEEVCNFHNRTRTKPEKAKITISEEWAKKLGQYEFFSRGISSKRPGLSITVKREAAVNKEDEPKKRTYEKF